MNVHIINGVCRAIVVAALITLIVPFAGHASAADAQTCRAIVSTD